MVQDELSPPTYYEALNDPPVPPTRPNTLSVPPTQPPRPHSNPGADHNAHSSPSPHHHHRAHSGSGLGGSSSTGASFSNNPSLPFTYPSRYFCNSCKNTGFKVKSGGGYCKDCWTKFYLSHNAYNPNRRLPFTYPKGFFCEKCYNTGQKRKNGKACQDCFENFAPRNQSRFQTVQSSSSPFSFFNDTVTTTTAVMPQQQTAPQPGHGFYNAASVPPHLQHQGPGYGYHAAPPQQPLYVSPGDPRIGGVQCGRCRGTGNVWYFLDEEICPVCQGLGRLLMDQFRPAMPAPAPLAPEPYYNNYVPPRKN